MYITSSANLRNNYRKIANRCKDTGEPVFLTTNGEGDLVLMSIDAYTDLINHRSIETELARVEAAEKSGSVSYLSLDDFDNKAKEILRVAETEATPYEHE